MSRPDVDIIGTGLVCCLGGDVDTVFEAMCRGECGMRTIDRFPSDHYPQPVGGQLPEDVEERLREEYPEEDIAAAMVKAAGLEAIQQAGLSRASAPDPRMGLVIATNFGPMETLEWCWRERIDLGTMDPDTFGTWKNFVADLATFFGCGGPAVQISLSCASGAATVAMGKDWIDTGRADRVLAVGYDALTEFCWAGLTNLHTITTDKLRPFDKRRAGTIFGEGAGALLLEKRQARESAGRPPLAWVAGAATNNNAFHMTAPAKEADGSRRVMASSLADGGIAPDAVDHICAHATGTTANDVTETAAFRNLFGDRLATMTVSAHKSQFAHLMGGAGAAEAIITIKAMTAGRIPPTINRDEPDPECDVDCVPDVARKRTFHCAVTNSAGIGGNNSSLVLVSDHGVSAGDKSPLALSNVKISGIGWVLPAGVGSGAEIIGDTTPFCCCTVDNSGLDGFKPKEYLTAVKGYLDPAGGYFLAASALALGDWRDKLKGEAGQTAGIASVTEYGAPLSGYRFYQQFIQKGPHFASPLLFPHSYSNTAGNLAAIEFEFGGPHMVYFGTPDTREALDFADTQLAKGTATNMLVGAYEAVVPDAVADGTLCMNGAVVVWLSVDDDAPCLATLTPENLRGEIAGGCLQRGSVASILAWLDQLK